MGGGLRVFPAVRHHQTLARGLGRPARGCAGGDAGRCDCGRVRGPGGGGAGGAGAWGVDVSIALELLEIARKSDATLATAESCTGGLIAGAITEVAGSSDVFDRGFVTYSNAAKQEMLGVQYQTLEAHGAVSEDVAGEMARGALERSTATLAVSVTGIAGPGGSDHKPEGRVCFGLAWGTFVITETVEFGPLGRSAVRQATVNHALRLMISKLSPQ
ncbi:MAG: CinA family protein [Vannielia sp.]